MKYRTLVAATLVAGIAIGFVSTAAGDPSAPPPPPPPPDADVTSTYEGNTSIQGCFSNYDSSTGELEYCDQPYIQYKTKAIYYCDDNANGQHDDGEKTGTYSDPVPDCGYSPYDVLKRETRQFQTCGKEDGEPDDYDPTPNTTNAEGWTCPSTKALSLRHESGNIDPGIGLAAEGYSDLSALTYKSGSDISYNLLASIPACVNRVPMIRLNVQMQDDYSNSQVSKKGTGKKGIYASHMNLYYGPNSGSTGQLKEIKMPDQNAYRRNYNVTAKVNSYRMWAWRQRFAGSVKNTVEKNNLQLPEDADVDQIAQDSPEGASVGDLWLSSDFLFGAQSPEPSNQTQTVIRNFDSVCTQDVREIEEENFKDVDEFKDFESSNPEQTIDILGKGTENNYCDITENQSITEITSISNSNTSEEEVDNKDGYLSTKDLPNVTEQLDTSVNVSKLDATYNGDDINTSDEFLEYHAESTEDAEQELFDSPQYWDQPEDGTIEDLKNFEKDSEQIVSFTVVSTRWLTGDEFDSMSNEEVFDEMEVTILNEDWEPNDKLKPTDRFEDVYIKEVISHKKSGPYEGSMKLKTGKYLSNYYAYIEMELREETVEKTSWNWRALQGVSMTTLAKCMYNWEGCMNNKRQLDSKSWDASEAYDSGYGPWEGSFTFNWSQGSAEEKGELLQEQINDTDYYNRTLDTSFDKYYDGARGYQEKEITSINSYRRCGSGEGWTSAKGEYYHEDHFICPDSTEANKGETANPSDVYRCEAAPASNLPDNVETAEEFDARQLGGDWYVCRTKSPGTWYKDESPPEVFVQKTQDAGGDKAVVSCTDEIATCNESTYRMKIYQSGSAPSECPEDYSEYDTHSGETYIGGDSYICATAKDKVGKVAFTEQPVDFDAQGINTQIVYRDNQISMGSNSTAIMFHRITNNAPDARLVNMTLKGVNASFEDGSTTKEEYIKEGQQREFEVTVDPQYTSETRTLWVETVDKETSAFFNDSIQVAVDDTSSASTATTSETQQVPGIGLVHLLFLLTAATALSYFSQYS